MSDDPQWYLDPKPGTEFVTRAPDGSYAVVRFIDGTWHAVHTCFDRGTVERLEDAELLRKMLSAVDVGGDVTINVGPVYRGTA